MIDALLAGCRVTRLLALSLTLGGSCVSACERVSVCVWLHRDVSASDSIRCRFDWMLPLEH